MKSVLVLGSINQDYVVQTQRAPRPGETILGKSLTTAPGGKGANQAVAAARLGANVRMFGAVGNDHAGEEMLDSLSAEGIDTASVSKVEGQSGSAVLTVTGDGENSIIVIAGANHDVGADQVAQLAMAIRPGDIVVMQLETPFDTVSAALTVAREGGALTILNAAPANVLLSDFFKVDVLIVNESEAALLSGLPVEDKDQAQLAGSALRGLGAHIVIVTLGGDGSVMVSDAGSLHVSAVPVNAIDTTGAGDTFVGAVAMSLAAGNDVPSAIRLASIAAAFTCTSHGAQTSMPTSSMISAHLSAAVTY